MAESTESKVTQVPSMDETVARLRSARSGKMSHITQRMNILNSLMTEKDFIDEVKENMFKFNEFLEEFKELHASYVKKLDERTRDEDNENWYQPRYSHITAFISNVDKWISAAENPSSPSSDKVTTSANPVENSFPLFVEKADVDLDYLDAQSQRSSGFNKSNTSSKSLRINAEAERAALLAKVSKWQEKHAIEDQEELLRKRRETLELNVEIEATNAKIDYLKSAEKNMTKPVQFDSVLAHMSVLGAEAAETSAAVQLDDRLDSLFPLPENAPVVRPKARTPVQFPPLNSGVDEYHSRPVFHPGPSSDTWPQLQHTLSHSFPYDGSSVIPSVTQPATSSARGTQFTVPQPQPRTPSTTSSPHETHMIKVLENQSELTRMLMKQQLLTTLPQGSIPIFDGQVLEYKSFIHSFQNMIERKTDNNRDRLQFLIQYTKGQAQRLVKSCEYMAPDRGYQMAMKLLKENFGNEYKISCAFLDKALSWPQIKSEDSKSLQDYAMFLRSCCNAMEEMSYMEELDTVSTMKSIILKLPYKLRERWRNKAYELQEQRDRRVRILDLVSFIEKQSCIAADPVFGDLQDQTAVRGKTRAPVKAQTSKSTSSSYVTSVALPLKETKPEPSCHFCSSKHTLDSCKTFMKKAHRDKLSFLKSKGICFGCLSTGHISKDCKRRLTCSMCKRAHPSTLHIEPKDNATKEAERPSDVIGSASAELCGYIGAGGQESVLSIVPVKVKAAKGSHVIKVYALLDPGSSATFCSEELMSRLHMRGKKTRILLRTMNQETSVPTHVVSGLEVSALDKDIFLPLPDTFTQKDMPVTTSSIPKQNDLAHWAYLSKVTIPSISSKVELLIGTNAPNLVEPWEVINSQNGGPYAVKTLLGWVVNGPLRCAAGSEESVTVNRISVASLEKMLISQYNQDFYEVASEEKTEMSIEDKMFLEIANEAVLENGHYSLRLPFRKSNVLMPNNRQIAEQRLHSLKKKMKNDEQFKQEYVAFLNDIFENNYAEEIPEEELAQPSGKVWYLPHHGVYHPKKKKLRISLDLDKDSLPVERALGLQWCVDSDHFQFNINLSQKPHTRRGILSVVSSIFDPLGFLAPLILPAKQLLQELCQKGFGWDEPLPQASGYGSVSYIRQENKQKTIHVTFVLGKSRVLPLKNITVPRLELAAAALLVKVDRMLRREFHLDLKPSVFWTDSQTVLKYIANDQPDLRPTWQTESR
ncbi:hypothetical protein ACEWY4_017522 [Coilia grayii]|uniref:CCHC-type domain-containing protein n=1 Tax=Coilia grayii TaxID=363190 RepID=A0ABD1JKI5_9TELE